MKVCYNRPCALYSVKSPFQELGADKLQLKVDETQDCNLVVHLTPSFSSAFFPRFSPDGKFLVFMSAESAVDTGAHSVTKSLHKMIWPAHGKPCPINDIVDVVKTPTLFLLGALDCRVPPSNGLQYARALKEKGVDVKIMVFAGDGHLNFRPQSEFESLLNIAVWFKKYLN